VHRVTVSPDGRFRQLVHGNTLHGLESLDTQRRGEPLSYYTPTSPIGQVFDKFSPRLKHVGVVGLGAGSLAFYARPRQQWTYYEIDPVVAQIAANPSYFSFLSRSKAPYEIILGDGRLQLSAMKNGHFDLLVLDAYSSDALPVHLLTREALQLYLRKLAPHGLLAFHISNRHLEIEPVLGNLAREANVVALNQTEAAISPAEEQSGKSPSQWLVIARHRADIKSLGDDKRWRPARTNDKARLWTDDYSSLLSVFNWD
jgi:spermidine synthase